MAATEKLQIIIEAVDKASGVSRSVASVFKTMGKDLALAGAGLGLAIAPAVAALGDATREATAFQATMTNTQAILGVTDDEIADISSDLLTLGAAAREGPQAVADAFGEIAGGVTDASTHMAIMEASIATAEAGAASLQGTTASLVSIMNAYGFAAEDAAMVSDVLTQTVGMGVLTMDELASAIPQVTGLAASLDVSFAELGGAMAYLTTQGFTASKASTQLQASMVALLNPNAVMTEALQELGVASGDLLVQEHGLVEALRMVAGTQTVASKGLAKTLGSTEALNAALALTGEGAEDFLDTFEASMEGATDAARQVQLGSFAAQMDLLQANVQTLRIAIGSALLPVINSLFSSVRPVVTAFTDWVRENPKMVQTIAGVVTVIGGLGVALGAVGTVLGAVGAGIGALVSPIGLVIAAVAALAVAYKENFLGFGDAVRHAVESVKTFAADVLAAFEVGGLEAAGQKIWDAIKSGFPKALDWVDEHIASPIAEALSGLDWPTALSGAGDVLQAVFDALVAGATVASEWVTDKIVDPVADEIGAVDWSAALAAAGDVLAGIFGGLVAGAEVAAAWVSGNMIDPIVAEISAVDWSAQLAAVPDAVQDILDALGGEAGEFHDWVNFNLVYPIVEHINQVDWPGLIAGIGGFVGDILDAAAAVGVDFATWAKENILDKVVDALGLQDWKPEFGAENSIIGAILDAAAGVVTDFAGWVEEHVAEPVISALGTVDWGTVASTIGEGALTVISSLLGAVALEAVNFAAWVVDHVAEPIATELFNADWIGIVKSVGNVFWNIFDAIRHGIVDIFVWVKGRIAQPIADELAAVDWIDLLKDIGTLILDAMADALGDVGQWAWDTIVQPIIDTLTSFDPTSYLKGTEAGKSVDPGYPGMELSLEELKRKRQDSSAIESQGSFGPSRTQDFGGTGLAGVPYLIGRGAQPELFIPDHSGIFVPHGEYAVAGVATGRGRGGGSPMVLNFEYKPLISLADEREAEFQLRPTIERILRANGLI